MLRVFQVSFAIRDGYGIRHLDVVIGHKQQGVAHHDFVAVVKWGGLADGIAIHEGAILAAPILDQGSGTVGVDPAMLARDLSVDQLDISLWPTPEVDSPDKRNAKTLFGSKECHKRRHGEILPSLPQVTSALVPP